MSDGPTFSPNCAKVRPRIFLVESFVQDKALGGEQLSFRDYPPEAQVAFTANLNASLTKLMFRTPQDPPSKKTDPLFQLGWKKTFAEVPHFLGRGDIVLGFAHLPPYEIADDGSMNFPPVSPCLAVVNNLASRFERDLRETWMRFVKTGLPKLSPPVPGQDGDAGGRSVWESFLMKAALKKGPEKNIFWSCKIGVVDIGVPANDAAMYVWNDYPAHRVTFKDPTAMTAATTKNPRLAIQNILMQLDPSGKSAGKYAFGVDAVQKAADAAKERRGRFLEAVGRGIAYATVHEFWHMAEEAGHKPQEYGAGDKVIESQPELRHEGLTLQEKAVTNIIKNYKSSWCQCILDNRLDVGAFTA